MTWWEGVEEDMRRMGVRRWREHKPKIDGCGGKHGEQIRENDTFRKFVKHTYRIFFKPVLTI